MNEQEGRTYGVFCADCGTATMGAPSQEEAQQEAFAQGWRLVARERLGERVTVWACPLCSRRSSWR
jgi:hypothetical protein